METPVGYLKSFFVFASHLTPAFSGSGFDCVPAGAAVYVGVILSSTEEYAVEML